MHEDTKPGLGGSGSLHLRHAADLGHRVRDHGADPRRTADLAPDRAAAR